MECCNKISELVIATGNQGKFREMLSFFSEMPIKLRLQSEWPIEEADETGLSFVENAIIKARHAAKHTGLPTLADDSGLEIAALDGKPGIYSARFAGENATWQDNINRVIDDIRALSNQPKPIKARFVCVLALMHSHNDATPLIFSGFWHGEIIAKQRGDKGFGYDPLFWLPNLKCTAAELPPAEKNRLSHRAQALQKMQAYLAPNT